MIQNDRTAMSRESYTCVITLGAASDAVWWRLRLLNHRCRRRRKLTPTPVSLGEDFRSNVINYDAEPEEVETRGELG